MYMKRVTTEQIALQLGVSRNTVSKALNGSENISSKTREYILQEAIAMGYKKKSFEEVQSKNNTKKDIFIILHERETADSFWLSMIRGVEMVAARNGFRTIITFPTKDEEEDLKLPAQITRNGAAAAIIAGDFQEDVYKNFQDSRIPTVFFDKPHDSKQLFGDTLIMDNFECVYQITTDLIEQGIHNIGFIGNINSCWSYYDRFRGYKHALKDNQIELDEKKCILGYFSNNYTFEQKITQNIETLISNQSFPEAFVCVNDHLAYAVYMFLNKLNPELSNKTIFTGFDNSMIFPGLYATVNPNMQQMGILAINLLFIRMKYPNLPYSLIKTSSKIIYMGMHLTQVTNK